MKVLHVINTLSAGGAELHLLTLCRFLKRTGVALEVACLREHVKGSRSLRLDFERENIRVINLKADRRYNLSFLGRLLSLVKRENPHIVHSHLPRADIAAALVSRMAYSPALVCSVHGIYGERWFGPWAAPLMRTAYRKADAVIAISAAVKNWLRRDMGVNDDKIRVIHYGIESERFNCPRDGRGHEAEKHSGRLTVGSIGRLEPGKGFECLIRALQFVREQIPTASLLIAGHDPLGYGKNLAGLIEELRLTEHVSLVGFHNDVPSFLRDIDIFAFASRSEGFGQVVIEAMASAKPVVVSNIAPLTEIVKDGESGYLANPGNPQAFAGAIVSLLSDPDRAAQMGRRGKQRVDDHFSAQRMADETAAVYESLLTTCQEYVSHAS